MIYHYTQMVHLESIMELGLQPYTYNLQPGEKPSLSFTTNPVWENTVFVINAPNISEAHQKMLERGGLVRISCEDSVAPYRFRKLCEVARIPRRMSRHLYSRAIEVGSNPSDWRGTLAVVPVDEFRAIDVYDGHEWTDSNVSVHGPASGINNNVAGSLSSRLASI
jgi:hypothetical protein